MKVNYDEHDRVCIVSIYGDLTGDHVDVVRRGVTERIERGIRDFVIVMPEMVFIDSAGLEMLLWLQDTAADALGQIRLVSPTVDVKKILEMTRLEGQFETHDEVTEAIRSLK